MKTKMAIRQQNGYKRSDVFDEVDLIVGCIPVMQIVQKNWSVCD